MPWKSFPVKPRTVLALAAACGIAVAGIAVAGSESDLAITTEGSGVPRTVTIVGPQSSLERIDRCRKGFSRLVANGNGLIVDWGDGTDIHPQVPQGASCADAQRSHTYTAPVRYRITLTASDPGPGDAPETSWQGEATVVVPGSPAR